ncbi:60S ribosomal export protein NMD3 [Halotydeus destructor]|nr:60S ribosomal export protein NMD3 [Halotydeus destructor]
MEYIEQGLDEIANQGKILCCQCGSLIDPNPANMCVGCLRSHVDITENIPKQVMLYFCKGCERYQQAQGQWVVVALESRELLTLCLKKLKGLNQVHLIDAQFVWTEPHSKRIKVKLVVQKEVLGGAVLQQTFVIEYVVQRFMCDNCHRIEAKDFWRAVTQVRQKATSKKTFFYLEQLLIKHGASKKCVSIKAVADGIDFFFDKRDDARKLVTFLETVVPCRYVPSQRLVSHDSHSNTAEFKHTYSVEIVPICKDDIVCLPVPLAKSLGNINQMCLCLRVTSQVYLIDPTTLRTAELNGSVFWRYPFKSISSSRQLTEYVVMNIELVGENEINVLGHRSEKHELADVWLVRASDLGTNDEEIHTKTHLGRWLNPGDSVLGFDLRNANINEVNFEKLEAKNANSIPEVVLVKKVFGDRNERKRKRQWKLRRLDVDGASDGTTANNDFNDFLDDIEEDPLARQHVNIYKDVEKLDSMMAIDAD